VSALVWAASAAWASELDGVWRFEKETNAHADGTPAAVPSAAYSGLIIYTADGHVSATIMPKDRHWTIANATFKDLMNSVGEGASTAYAGRFEVDPVARTVTHIPDVSIDPADIGQRLVRHYQVSGDELLLSGKWKYQGEELTFTVHWRRVEPIAAGASHDR